MDNEEKNKTKIDLTAAELLTTQVQTKNPLTINAIDLATTVQPKII